MAESLIIRGEHAGDTYTPTQERGGLKVRFFIGSAQDVNASHAAERPILVDVEYVELSVGGDVRSAPVKKVTTAIKRQYKAEYDAWKRGEDAPLSGKSLAEWGFMKVSQVETLKFFGITTLQEFAAASDTALQNIGSGYADARDKARALCEILKHTEVMHQAVKSAPETVELTDKVEALTKQVELLLANAQKPLSASAEVTEEANEKELESVGVSAGSSASVSAPKKFGTSGIASSVGKVV